MGAKVIGASEQSYSVQGQEDTPVFGHKYVMDDEEWDTFCNGMNYLGKIAKEEYGIAFGFSRSCTKFVTGLTTSHSLSAGVFIRSLGNYDLKYSLYRRILNCCFEMLQGMECGALEYML